MGRGICFGVLSAAIAGCSGIPDASDVSMNIHRGMSYEEVFVMAGAYEMERSSEAVQPPSNSAVARAIAQNS